MDSNHKRYLREFLPAMGAYAVLVMVSVWLLKHQIYPPLRLVFALLPVIPALLAMKGHAVHGRYKQKDSYDIYYCIRNYPDGIERLAEACRPLLRHVSAARGFGFVAEKFDRPDAYGPTCVRRFVEDTRILGDWTPDQWQQDAFGQVDAWLRAIGFRGDLTADLHHPEI